MVSSLGLLLSTSSYLYVTRIDRQPESMNKSAQTYTAVDLSNLKLSESTSKWLTSQTQESDILLRADIAEFLESEAPNEVTKELTELARWMVEKKVSIIVLV